MKNSTIVILLFIGLIVFISGCTSSNSTQHFDNGFISFDYPADMDVKEDNSTSTHTVTISKGMSSGASVSTYKFFFDQTFDSYANQDTGVQKHLTKFTIDGRAAYNITTTNEGGSESYSTIVDVGNGALIISADIESNTKNQTTTDSYKAYSTIVQTLKFKGNS